MQARILSEKYYIQPDCYRTMWLYIFLYPLCLYISIHGKVNPILTASCKPVNG